MIDEFFTVEEIADKLKVSEQTIRAWIREGRLEAYKFGRAHRIPAASFQQFMEQSKQASQSSGDAAVNKKRPVLAAAF
jgi:excisionase family DNA binding protein